MAFPRAEYIDMNDTICLRPSKVNDRFCKTTHKLGGLVEHPSKHEFWIGSTLNPHSTTQSRAWKACSIDVQARQMMGSKTIEPNGWEFNEGLECCRVPHPFTGKTGPVINHAQRPFLCTRDILIDSRLISWLDCGFIGSICPNGLSTQSPEKVPRIITFSLARNCVLFIASRKQAVSGCFNCPWQANYHQPLDKWR